MKALKSTFLSRHRESITEFANHIVRKNFDLIVAISRKAPRLLMLIEQFEDGPQIPWGKCVTEKALPFIDASELKGGKIIVVDDTLIFGSTLSSVIEDVTRLGADVESCVLTMSRGAHVDISRRVHASLKIQENEIAAFIDDEVQSFGSLGIPYDVDHPIIGITSPDNIEAIRRHLTFRTSGLQDDTQPWHSSSDVATLSDQATEIKDLHSMSHFQCGPCQVRLFFDSQRGVLNIVPLFCLALKEQDVADPGLFDSSPQPLGNLWRAAVEANSKSPLDAIRKVQGLMNVAHYLASFEFGWRWISSELSNANIEAPFVYHRDLRLILGNALATSWLDHLNSALMQEPSKANVVHTNKKMDDTDYAQHELASLTKTRSGLRFLRITHQYLANTSGTNTREALAAILEAQRFVWDESTRSHGTLDSGRLDIALSYGAMKSLLEQSGYPISEIGYRSHCNFSIDAGLMVPRYVCTADREKTWLRGIRFGENLSHLQKIKYWLDYVLDTATASFGRLHKTTEEIGLPWFIFEKLLASLQISLHGDLDAALSTDIRLGFDEFGARTFLAQYPRQPFVIDWAVDAGIFHSVYETSFQRQSGAQSSGRVILRSRGMAALFPPNRNPLDRGFMDRTASLIETFMVLESAFHWDKRNDVIHALTTCHDEPSYLSAISKENELWLFHSKVNSSSLAMSLMELSQSSDPVQLKTEATRLDKSLSKSAHFLGQTEIKKKAFDMRQSIVTEIDGQLSKEGRFGHCSSYWTNSIRPHIDLSRSEHADRETYLRFAAALASRAISIVRTVLSENGLVVDKRSHKDRKTLSHHIQVYNDYISKAKQRGLSCVLPPLANISTYESQDLAERLVWTASLLENVSTTVYGVWESWHYPTDTSSIIPFEDDRAVLLWDVADSSKAQRIKPQQDIIDEINRDFLAIAVREEAVAFDPDQDDGNGMICKNVSSAIRIFKAGAEKFRDHGYTIRGGIETTISNEKLWRNQRTGRYGGRPYQMAARLRDFYKEVSKQLEGELTYVPAQDTAGTPQQPTLSFLVLSNSAKVSITAVDKEIIPDWVTVYALAHNYVPRLASSLPMTVHVYSLVGIENPRTVMSDNQDVQGRLV